MIKIEIEHTGLRFDEFNDTFYDDSHCITIDEEANIEQVFAAFCYALICAGFSSDLVEKYRDKLKI